MIKPLGKNVLLKVKNTQNTIIGKYNYNGKEKI